MSEDTGDDGTDDVAKREHGRAIDDVIPKPVEATPSDADYRITEGTTMAVDDQAAHPVASYLADLLRGPTGFDLPVTEATDSTDSISLRLADAPADVGEEGYELTVTDDGVTIRAEAPAGLFAGVQTLRQLLPPSIESDSVESGPWSIPGGEILDYPRFAYRGVHFDVSRHFFPVEDLERLVDYLALYKLNHLHLHLTDDQGWRIEIESWPKLTEVGGSTEVGGGDGGYYTQEEYADFVDFAADRFVTVVPEIDMPGHTNAAQASYGELNADGEPTDLYTGTDVGFSALPVDEEVTYEFVEDVLREVADLTQGPFVHVGGDEAHEHTDEEYERFVNRVAPMVDEHGKRPMGWHQILAADVPDSTVGQYWSKGPEPDDYVAAAVEAGHELVLSPATRAYLDLKYDEDTELGLDWAGHISVRDAYDWDPGDYVEGVDESAVLGVEAPLWSETLETLDDVEFLLFPRVAAIAELGWSPAGRTGWDDFERRLAAQAPRWGRLGINYYRSPQIDWPDDG